MVDICGYELPTMLQNFMQKDLTEVKILLSFFLGGEGATIFEASCTADAVSHVYYSKQKKHLYKPCLR